MNKLDFFLGKWKMECNVPESAFSKADKGTGIGEFKKELDDKYVVFNYKAKLSSGKGAAHGIFAWDSKEQNYKYWWFEDSGNFMTATCNFINDDTLHLNWHNSLLIQTFKKESKDKVVLKMEHPSPEGKYELVLEVIFRKIH